MMVMPDYSALPQNDPQITALVRTLSDPAAARGRLEELNGLLSREKNLTRTITEIQRLAAAAAADREAADAIRADTEAMKTKREAALAARGAVLDRVERELAELNAAITEAEGLLAEDKAELSSIRLARTASPLPRRPRCTSP
jgi:chromosome segregation ATPase